MNHATLTWIVCFAILAALPQTAAALDAVDNASFEEVTGAFIDPQAIRDNWQRFDGDDGQLEFADSTISGTFPSFIQPIDPVTGSHHLALWLSNGQPSFVGVIQALDGVIPGTDYDFSAQARFADAATFAPGFTQGEAIFELKWLGPGDQEISRVERFVQDELTMSYQTFSVIDTAPVGAVAAQLGFIVATGDADASNGDLSGLMYVDDVTFATVAPTVLVGDYNDNGVVDAADYTIYRDNDGTAFSLTNRDPAVTGDVGPADYTAWANNFGATSNAVATPEPGTIGMTLLAAIASIGRSRRGV